MPDDTTIDLPDWDAEPGTYRDALLAVLGTRDPVEVLATSPQRVRELLDGRAPDALTRRPADGEWSVAEIVGHLLDDEIIFAFRLRLPLTADQPAYPGTEPERWAQLPQPPIAQLLAAWESLRAYNVWLLRALPRDGWNRVGLHEEQGPETVEINVRKTAGHELAHLDQLERCLNDVVARRT